MLKKLNRFIQFTDFMFYLAFMMILIIKLYFDTVIEDYIEIPDNVVDSFFAFGWTLLSLIFSIMVIFFLIMNWGTILMIKKSFDLLLVKFKNKRLYKEVSKQTPNDLSSSRSHQDNSKL